MARAYRPTLSTCGTLAESMLDPLLLILLCGSVNGGPFHCQPDSKSDFILYGRSLLDVVISRDPSRENHELPIPLQRAQQALNTARGCRGPQIGPAERNPLLAPKCRKRMGGNVFIRPGIRSKSSSQELQIWDRILWFKERRSDLALSVVVLRLYMLTADKLKENTFNPSFSLLTPPSGIAGLELDAHET